MKVAVFICPAANLARPTCRFPTLPIRQYAKPWCSGTWETSCTPSFQAMTADDHAAIAAMVKYPLTVYSSAGRPATYRNAAALSANYTRVFTPEVKAAVAAAKPDDLFVRDQGVMIGNGEIWMNEIGGSMKIITVNHTR